MNAATSTAVVVIEDEADFRELLVFKLKEAGFAPEAAGTGHDGLALAKSLKPAVVVLDLMLPDIAGTEVCKQIRADRELANVSVLMLTAKGEEIDRVVGFELGADDYVVKPCSVRELMLRVRALARRANERSEAMSALGASKPIVAGVLRIDPAAHRATISNEEVSLTPLEFKLLLLFVSNPGRAFSREKLLGDVWEITADVTTRTVDTHVKRLREKLGEYGETIETVRGVGYRFRGA
jgi:two-component system phosphate regulon response regulator PhoB